jgi:hypothetical protein
MLLMKFLSLVDNMIMIFPLGALASGITTPLDVAKTRIMLAEVSAVLRSKLFSNLKGPSWS